MTLQRISIESPAPVMIYFRKLLPHDVYDYTVISGSVVAMLGGLTVAIMDNPTASAGLVVAFAGLITAVAGLIVPLARILLQYLDLSGQLGETRRQLALARKRLTVLEAKGTVRDETLEKHEGQIQKLEESGFNPVVKLDPDTE